VITLGDRRTGWAPSYLLEGATPAFLCGPNDVPATTLTPPRTFPHVGRLRPLKGGTPRSHFRVFVVRLRIVLHTVRQFRLRCEGSVRATLARPSTYFFRREHPAPDKTPLTSHVTRRRGGYGHGKNVCSAAFRGRSRVERICDTSLTAAIARFRSIYTPPRVQSPYAADRISPVPPVTSLSPRPNRKIFGTDALVFQVTRDSKHGFLQKRRTCQYDCKKFASCSGFITKRKLYAEW